MTKHQDNLTKYASLAIQLGVNVQPGQTLVIFAPLVSVDFVRLLVKLAYEIGAKLVYVEWSDSEITRLKYELAPFEALLEHPMWQAKGYEELASQNAAFLYVSANNPDLMNGIDPKRLQTASKTSSTATKGLTMARLTNKVSWTIVAVPTPAWRIKFSHYFRKRSGLMHYGAPSSKQRGPRKRIRSKNGEIMPIRCLPNLIY